jgi:pectate lyase
VGAQPNNPLPPLSGSNPAAAANPSNPAPSTGGVRTPEGNPAVTELGGGNPSTAAPPASPPAASPPAATPPAATPPAATPPVTANVRPPDVEPTDCVIPAAATRPIGYGQNTTGGGNAAPVVVNSFAQAEAALATYREAFKDGVGNALVLRYTGTFDFASITDVCTQHNLEPQVLEIKEMENVTFEGARGSRANFGIKVNRAKNVIIRNMTMGLLPGGGDSDAITIEGNDTNGDVENVWVDHNELFSSTKDDCAGAGDTEFDGLLDIKKGARFITVSYNYLHDHQKTGLMGFSDSDDTDRYVTFHHNRYENVVSRTPLQRFGYVHLLNNYYGRISSSGINVRMGGVALIESNFFENAANPITSRFSGELGFWDLRNNHVGAGITWSPDPDLFANADDWQSTTAFPASELTYTYTADRAGCVKQIVTALAGAKL